MCELFGYSAETKYEVNEYLKTFFKHSPKNPNGWGLACMDGNEAMIEKEPIQATKSNYLKERLKQPVLSHNVFGHIRFATIGNEEYSNCHPLSGKDATGRRWTVIHNGTIFDFEPLSKYIKVQEGTTDSERVLLYIIDKINRTETEDKRLSGRERFEIIDCLIGNMAKGNKLNFMIYDGEYMYVHTNYKDSLYYLEKEGAVFFSTGPLTGECWKNVPFTRLLAYKNGKLIFTGKSHGHEYIDSEENMRFIFQNYSQL
ncbi:MAG: class II glutamine amidotransferase [Eubacterium sp.]|nr:class II glutamine amidotransferase [Eubacterium sp.]